MSPNNHLCSRAIRHNPIFLIENTEDIFTQLNISGIYLFNILLDDSGCVAMDVSDWFNADGVERYLGRFGSLYRIQAGICQRYCCAQIFSRFDISNASAGFFICSVALCI